VAVFAAWRAAFPMAWKKASRNGAKAQRLQHFFLPASRAVVRLGSTVASASCNEVGFACFRASQFHLYLVFDFIRAPAC